MYQPHTGKRGHRERHSDKGITFRYSNQQYHRRIQATIPRNANITSQHRQTHRTFTLHHQRSDRRNGRQSHSARTRTRQSRGRGKRSQVLAIDTDFWRIVSIDLSNPKLAKGALADLSGRIVDRTELPADNGCSVDDVISLCKQLIASTPLPILGIGIAVTGIVEPDGVVRKSVHLEWNELPLKAEVENATGVPTLVGNDTNAALVAKRFFGDCSPNSMLISIGRGVGAALCLNDVIIEGSSSTAGEIAHVVVDPNGPTCECGKRGCLESLVSDDRLQERIAQDPASRTRILAEAGALLGRVMAIPAGLLDLRDISIYGAPEIVNAQFIDAMEDEIRRTMTTDYQKAPQIHRCRQGEDLTLRGQATIVIRTLVPTIHERGSLIGDA